MGIALWYTFFPHISSGLRNIFYIILFISSSIWWTQNQKYIEHKWAFTWNCKYYVDMVR